MKMNSFSWNIRLPVNRARGRLGSQHLQQNSRSIGGSHSSGCSGAVVKYQTHNREVACSTHTRSTASNLEQVANLLHAQANLASYPQWDGK